MKKLLSGVSAFVLSLGLGASAFAQDVSMQLGAEPDVSFLGATSAPVVLQGGGDRPYTLSLMARFTLPPDGEIDTGLDYDDVMEMGVGALIEFDYLIELPGGLKVGPYGSVGFDVFSGDEISGGGLTLDPDDFMTVTLIVGGKLGHRPPEGVFLDGRLGIGIIQYLGTDAALSGAEFELVDSSTEFIGEIGARVGWGTESVILQLGVIARVNGGPDGGDVTLDSDTMIQYGFDVGIGIRF